MRPSAPPPGPAGHDREPPGDGRPPPPQSPTTAAQLLHFPDASKLELDELIDRLVEQAMDVRRAQGRLRSLLRAVSAVSGEQTLTAVLENVVGASRELAEAGWGALGVLGDDGRLTQFIRRGGGPAIDEHVGRPPQTMGLLGAVLIDPRPLRRADLRTEDTTDTAAGPTLPTSFLGVPVIVDGDVFGALYLGDSAHGEFSADDEELVVALATAAGAAIGTARAAEASRQQRRWLEASLEIGARQATGGGASLQLITERAHEVADADLVTVTVVTSDRDHLVIGAAHGRGSERIIGRHYPIEGTLAGRAIEQAAPIRSIRADRLEGSTAGSDPVIDAGPVMVLPLGGADGERGALSVIRARGRSPFTQRDLDMAAGFAAHASVALALADSRSAERRLVLLEDRDRIAMDLHDHVIQELFAIGLGLEGIAAHLELGAEHGTAERVRAKVEDIDRTIRRIRTSIFDLRGPLLPDGDGLRRAVRDIVTDLTPALGATPHLEFLGHVDDAPGRSGDPTLADDVVACVREALTNTARHAHARVVSVEVAVTGRELIVTVTDDGVGVGDSTRRSGTANLQARAERHGGTFAMISAPGEGTTVRWTALLP